VVAASFNPIFHTEIYVLRVEIGSPSFSAAWFDEYVFIS
jgi:hypothetical protein